MTFADVFVGSVMSFIHCHTFMISKYKRPHVAFDRVFSCKVYILIIVMTLLSVSVCLGRNGV